MVRTQLYLDEEIHARLRELSRKQGRSISDLVREALERTYGKPGTERELATLRAIFGLLYCPDGTSPAEKIFFALPSPCRGEAPAGLRAKPAVRKDRDDIGDTREYGRRLRDDSRRRKYLEKVWRRNR